jgi:hypothetical protein
MKTNLLSAALGSLAALCTSVAAAPLTETTAVHTKPDKSAPAVTFLKAGTEPNPLADAVATTPAGWLAVQLPGPFEVYAQNKDLAKSLDVKPGSNLYLGPKLDSGVLTLAQKDDKATITGLHGKWTQLRLERNLTGYIYVGTAPGYLPAVATTPAAPAPSAPTAPAQAAPLSAPPVAPGVYGVAAPGQAASANLGDGGASLLPRQFAGKFITTRSPFKPRRPYDWALADDAGKRYAYLDVSKLLLTDQIENYANHAVVVFGAAKAVPETKDIVIQVETLQLK